MSLEQMKESGKEEMDEYVRGPEVFERMRQVEMGCSSGTRVQS